MTADPKNDPEPPGKGERIAKRLARAGLCSRRDAERWIEAGRVSVDGKVLESPALNVLPGQTILVDGNPLPDAEPPALWRYHKPSGLVTTNRDPRPLAFPPVPAPALTYLLYLLREVDHGGTLLQNPYLASVGLAGDALDDRLRGLSDLSYQRQGAVTDLSWAFPSLAAWADARLAPSPLTAAAPAPGAA